MSQEQLNLETIQGELQTARGSIAGALGLPANLPFDLQRLPSAIPVGAIGETVGSAIEEAVRNRPDLAAARAEAQAASAQVRVTRAAELPAITLGSKAGRTYSVPSLFGGTSYGLSLGISIPIFNGFSYQYNVAAARADAAVAVADQAQATAAASAATVDADRAAVERAHLDVANCQVRAPISGRTGGLLVRRGNLVKANSDPPLVVINQIQPILVRFSVPQSQFPDIQRYYSPGSPLPVRATASEGTATPMTGTLAFLDNNVDSTTGTVLLKARFANGKATLWPGQYVTVALQLYVDSNAVTLPAQAVLTGQQGTYVFTVDSGCRSPIRRSTFR